LLVFAHADSELINPNARDARKSLKSQRYGWPFGSNPRDEGIRLLWRSRCDLAEYRLADLD